MARLIMSRAYHIGTRVFAVFGMIAFCTIIIFVAITMWKMPIHQFNLWRLEKNFQAIAMHHPPESKLLGTVRNFGGLFSGVSHSCDYFVGEIRSTTRSQAEIRQIYHGLSVDSIDHVRHIPVTVHFFDEEDFFIHYPWYEWDAKLRQSFGISAPLNDVYAVFISEAGYPPYGDMRCY